MKRRIVLEKGEGKRLAELFNCTPQTVCYALTFKHDSEFARKIRKAALANGGVEIGSKPATTLKPLSHE
jgi:hypothetical protein